MCVFVIHKTLKITHAHINILMLSPCPLDTNLNMLASLCDIRCEELLFFPSCMCTWQLMAQIVGFNVCGGGSYYSSLLNGELKQPPVPWCEAVQPGELLCDYWSLCESCLDSWCQSLLCLVLILLACINLNLNDSSESSGSDVLCDCEEACCSVEP